MIATTSPGARVLFVSHNASRTGAPIFLLHFIKWLHANSNFEIHVLLKEGGELEQEFQAVGPTTTLSRQQQLPVSLVHRVRRRAGWETKRAQQRQQAIISNLEKMKFDLVYSNTITNGRVMAKLAALNCPMLCHVHELEYIIRQLVRPEQMTQVIANSAHFVAVSQAVRQNLVKSHGIEDSKISVVHGFIPEENFKTSPGHRSNGRSALGLAAMGISENALLVGGAGAVQWRKGPDLFVQMARACQQKLPPEIAARTYYLWMGRDEQGEQNKLQFDIEQCGLAERVMFLGERSEPAPFFAVLDVFALVSREDPYPLVALEAGAAGNALVGFEGSGGVSELIEKDCGFTVPYLDVDSMAGRVCELLCDDNLRSEFGSCAASKVRERHSIEVGAPQLLEVMERVVARS